MALSGIPRIDDLLAGAPAAAPLAAGDADRVAVGGVQDLLAGYGFSMPTLAAADYGLFGPKTRAAVRGFRLSAQLPSGETVDPPTLAALVAGTPASPRACRTYLTLVLDETYAGLAKILCFVAQVEGAGRFAAINANTDGQGLSYGLIQWAQGQGRLPELLNAFSQERRDDFVRILGGGDAAVADRLLAHVAKPNGGIVRGEGTTTDPDFDLVADPWRARFAAAGAWRPFQSIQVRVAVASLQRSLDFLRGYAADMTSERCVAFMLDLANQRGDAGARQRYRDARRDGMAPNDVLQAITDADPRFASRHAVYLATSLLSDEPFPETPAVA